MALKALRIFLTKINDHLFKRSSVNVNEAQYAQDVIRFSFTEVYSLIIILITGTGNVNHTGHFIDLHQSGII